MKACEIPGGTATVLDREELTVRRQRLISAWAVGASKAIEKLPADKLESLTAEDLLSLDLTAEDADAMYRLQDATIVAALESWTLDGPLPTMDTIGDLPPDVYAALSDATKEVGAAVAIGEDPGDPIPSTTTARVKSRAAQGPGRSTTPAAAGR